MTTITLTLPDDRVARLKELAEAAGLTPEDLLRASVEAWLAQPNEDFTRAANYVLRKNAELYRRLA
jgi:hypothetical protein